MYPAGFEPMRLGEYATNTPAIDRPNKIPLCAQYVFFFGRVFGIFDVSGLDTEHESVFLGLDPVYAAGG